MLKQELSGKIICCFYNVYNTLGHGFLEKVYKNAMMIEFGKYALQAETQRPIKVYYDNQLVGEYFADIIVEDSLIIEIKAVNSITEAHDYQIINYLRATNIEVGLLFNFGETPEFRRRVFSNDRKKNFRHEFKNGMR